VKSISLFRLQSLIISGHFLLAFGTASSFAVSGVVKNSNRFSRIRVRQKNTLDNATTRGLRSTNIIMVRRMVMKR